MAEDEDANRAEVTSGADLSVGGSIVGRDSIQSTTHQSSQTVTHIDGGPVARYAVLGIVCVALASLILLALVINLAWRPDRSASIMTPPATVKAGAALDPTAAPTASTALSATNPVPPLVETPLRTRTPASSPATSTGAALTGFGAEVTDSGGNTFHLDNILFSFEYAFNAHGSVPYVTLKLPAGYIRIAFADIAQIERTQEAELGKANATIAVRLHTGKIVEGIVGEPFAWATAVTGQLNGLEFRISAADIRSIVFPANSTPAEGHPGHENSDETVTASLQTRSGEPLILNDVRLIWLANSSGATEFQLGLGQASVTIQVAQLDSLDAATVDSHERLTLYLIDGKVLEGTYLTGWSLAGQTPLGLVLVPFQELAHVEFARP